MTTTQVAPPYPIFTDVDGTPLNDGYIYLGFVNTNPELQPIPAYWDSALTIPAAQPIRTVNGYPSRQGSPAQLYTNGTFSITIRNKVKAVVLYSSVGYSVNPSSVASNSDIVTVLANMGSINAAVASAAVVNAAVVNAAASATAAGNSATAAAASATYLNSLVRVNGSVISANLTIPTTSNALSVGPITVPAGVNVTVPTNSNWRIL
jgi:hypothetical protein